MDKLDLDILHLEEILSDEDYEWSCQECKDDHIRLLNFLLELKRYREAIAQNEATLEPMKLEEAISNVDYELNEEGHLGNIEPDLSLVLSAACKFLSLLNEKV